ncbi:unnamed protein product [Staurois parvus]|uniref:Uncharacterized protein n=1 Tax=Staurois parvus TaxID=386267 RepID=A0ABN9F605_9NEOB|nr:unnamed protein product [Staurois parvus]
MTRICGHSTGDDRDCGDTVQEMTRDCGHSTGDDQRLRTQVTGDDQETADIVKGTTRDCGQYRDDQRLRTVQEMTRDCRHSTGDHNRGRLRTVQVMNFTETADSAGDDQRTVDSARHD